MLNYQRVKLLKAGQPGVLPTLWFHCFCGSCGDLWNHLRLMAKNQQNMRVFCKLQRFLALLPCFTMFYHVLPCFTMFYHVLPCFTMFYHVLPFTNQCHQASNSSPTSLPLWGWLKRSAWCTERGITGMNGTAMEVLIENHRTKWGSKPRLSTGG